jgi:hypothetical protein
MNSMAEQDLIQNFNKNSKNHEFNQIQDKQINLQNFNSTTKKVLINLPIPVVP